MRDESTLLDHLEEWLTAQVPKDLHDLPLRMIETMERVSNELSEWFSDFMRKIRRSTIQR